MQGLHVWVTGPLARLRLAVADVARGNYQPDLPAAGSDDIGDLTRGFGAMTAEVATRTADLERARDDAQAGARAKAEFLALMSHEIRTPMNGVLGIASVLAQTPLDADQRELLELMQRSGDDLMRLLNDILDLSRLEADRLELEPQEVDIVGLTRDVVDLMRGAAVAKGLEISFATDVSDRQAIELDGGRLRQVLLNLIGNAIKFTETGSVSVTLVEQPADYAWAIRDTGIGIANDALATLFDDFVQADASIQRRFGGSGLGLAISRRLAERMGGTLSVTSTLGVGSVFSVRLPRGDLAPG
jgi:signal transduction histidine kinase